jgi:hypothetical protein
MSLIVGFASDDIGFMVADTLFSYPTASYDPREPTIEKFHGLKIQILTSDVAVAFAGNVQAALTIITALHQELLAYPYLSVPDRLVELRSSLTAEGRLTSDCDFLVLWIANDQKKRLAHISNNRFSYCQRAYIGDPHEYHNFRALWKPYRGPTTRRVQCLDGHFENVRVTEGEREFDQASNAMEELTHQRRSATVGAICGCVIRVVDARISGKLEYMQSVESSRSPEEGEAGFSLLASNVEPRRGIGLYFRRWHAGLIFMVGDSVPSRKEEAHTIQDFVMLARQKYGLSLEGGVW